MVAVFLVASAGCAEASSPSPTFAAPVPLVSWLLQNSGHGFDAFDDTANDGVYSPGFRAALRTTMARSRHLHEPPCGADGDFILDTQESGLVQNLRLVATVTAPDRMTVAASYDIAGSHRDRRFMTVNLNGAWKLENILEPDGSSLRREFATCKP